MAQSAAKKVSKSKSKSKRKSFAKALGQKPKPSKDGEKPSKHFSPYLKDKMDEFAACKAIVEAATRKMQNISIPDLTNFALSDHAKDWINNGEKPPTTTWKGNRSNMDVVIQNYATNLNTEQIQDETGIDVSSFVEEKSVTFSLEGLDEESYNAVLALAESLKDKTEIKVDQKYSKDLYPKLPELANYDPNTLKDLMISLKIKITKNGVHSVDKEDDLFDFVKGLAG